MKKTKKRRAAEVRREVDQVIAELLRDHVREGKAFWRGVARPHVVDVIAALFEAAGVRCCERCGCTEDSACRGGCGWVGLRLCSSCATRAEVRDLLKLNETLR